MGATALAIISHGLTSLNQALLTNVHSHVYGHPSCVRLPPPPEARWLQNSLGKLIVLAMPVSPIWVFTVITLSSKDLILAGINTRITGNCSCYMFIMPSKDITLNQLNSNVWTHSNNLPHHPSAKYHSKLSIYYLFNYLYNKTCLWTRLDISLLFL